MGATKGGVATPIPIADLAGYPADVTKFLNGLGGWTAPAAAGVTSWKGRAGVVVPAAGDYTGIAVGGTADTLAVGGLTNAMVAAGAAIAYSKLALGASIVNADIAAGAAIAASKLALASYAASQSTPGDPASTVSTTGVMMGLAGAITPTGSGKILVTVYGWIVNASNLADARAQICTGTGAAPSNGDAPAGTARGTNVDYAPAAAGDRVPFSATVLVTGLVVGTAYWIDLKAWTTSGAAATSMGGITISAVELP